MPRHRRWPFVCSLSLVVGLDRPTGSDYRQALVSATRSANEFISGADRSASRGRCRTSILSREVRPRTQERKVGRRRCGERSRLSIEPVRASLARHYQTWQPVQSLAEPNFALVRSSRLNDGVSAAAVANTTGRNGEGFRMPASTGRASGVRAGVRKPPKGERARGSPALWRFGGGGEPARRARQAWPASFPSGRILQRLGGSCDRGRSSSPAGRRCRPGRADISGRLSRDEPVRWPKLRCFDPALKLAVPGHDVIIRISNGAGEERGLERRPRSFR